MSKASNYYYEQLNKEQQKAYYAMKEGLLNQQDSFAVPMLDKKELSDIYFMVRMDCPEIFYSVRFSYRYYPDSTAVEFIPEYLFQKDKIREHRQAMQARVKKLARQAQGLDEKGKELFIHDFIVQNVRYDKLKKEYSHEIIGALGNGVALTDGNTAAYKLNPRTTLKLGPYFSYLMDGDFSGHVYEGYLRETNPTGDKINFTNGAIATYDFSGDLRKFQWGVQAGVDWKAFKHLKVHADLNWGLNDIFNKDFKTVTFDMYAIYLNVGFGYAF